MNFLLDPDYWSSVRDRASQMLNPLRNQLNQADLALYNSMPASVVTKLMAMGYQPPESRTPQDPATAMMNAMPVGVGSIEDAGKNALTWAKLLPNRTSKVISRLSPTVKGYTPARIQQELNRQDVSKPEKDLIGEMLNDFTRHGMDPDRVITPQELAQNFSAKTRDYSLTPRGTTEYADYGIENIGRLPLESQTSQQALMDIEDEFRRGDLSLREYEQSRARLTNIIKNHQDRGVPSRTTMYEMPNEVPHSNHFKNPRLFGWTRSFDEGGIRHVVEVQSDLAQHLAGLSGDKLKAAKEELADLSSKYSSLLNLQEEVARKVNEKGVPSQLEVNQLLEKMKELGVRRRPGEDILSAMDRAVGSNYLRQHELKASIESANQSKKYGPMMKNWEKRLVQHELGQAAKQGHEKIRFATPGTVRQVEGWDDMAMANIEVDMEDLERDLDKGAISEAEYERSMKALEEEEYRISHGEGELPEELKGIERRYRDLEKYLKGMGGKLVTDDQGVGWIEVPVPKEHVPHLWGIGAAVPLTAQEHRKQRKNALTRGAQ